MNKIQKVANPLTIIAIFAALTEVMGTIVSANNSSQFNPIVYFLMGFPTLLVLLFFLTLNFNPKVLYSPSDFVDENNYMRINESNATLKLELEELKRKLNESPNMPSKLEIDEIQKSIDETINAINNYLAKYYVNKIAQANGDHEVHTSGCTFMPSVENRIYLGEFTSCKGAVTVAKKTYKQVNGCYYCCSSCHTT